MLLLCALIAGSGTVWAEETELISWSRSSTTDTYTTGYTFQTSDKASSKTGYYQDSGTKDVSVISLSLFHNTNKLFSTTLKSVTFKAKLGAGSVKDPLGNNVKVCFVDKDGNDIEGSAVDVTSKITNKDGSDFSVSMSIAKAADAYGVKIFHTKEDGWNVRYYGFSLSYEAAKVSDSPLASIALSGTYPTSFAVGDEFSSEGMTVTATYENGETNDVTANSTFSGYDMATKGVQTVTVSYTEKEVTKTTTYSINIKGTAGLVFTPSAVVVGIGGNETLSLSKATDATASFVVDDETIATYDAETGKVTGLKEGTTTITATTSESADYAAGEAVCTITVVDPDWIDYTKKGYTNAALVTEEIGLNGKVTLAKAAGGTAPAWYDSGSAVRIYANNTITVTAKDGYVLTGVEFSVTSGSMAADKFDKEVTKVGKTNEFTLTTPAKEIVYTPASNFRIDKVKLVVAPIATFRPNGFCPWQWAV